jgi:hypothetical protein
MSLNENEFENDYEMNYELEEDMNVNVDIYDRNDLNKLSIAAAGEDLNHFSCKAVMFYVLSEMNHDVICDHHIIGVGDVDIYDMSTRTVFQFVDDDGCIDELQLIKNDILLRNVVDVIYIDPGDLPDDIFQRYLKLREYVICS